MVGVDDDEYGQRVAAIVNLSRNTMLPSGESLTIDRLRGDMRRLLPAYKLPTLLRIVEGELPKGQTGKVQKKVLGPQLFPVPGWRAEKDVQVWSPRGIRNTAKM